ncbi:MAG: tetratricopeptide repeat protein [Myxococcota bacterium]|jgi:TolA-binding protein|nr:tetratricopeptide repeat protein [Myxococcota bacterium]
MTRWRWLFGLLFVTLFAPGFVCASRVERVEGEVDALRAQFVEIQQRVNNEQTQLSEMIVRADLKLAELEELQRKANELLTRNSVDLSLQIENQRNELAELRGRLDGIDRNVSLLSKEVQGIIASLGSVGSSAVLLPTESEPLFTFAQQREGEKNWAEAKLGYQEFILKFSSDPRVEEATYRLAVVSAAAGQHQDAITTVRGLLTSFPNSSYRNDAIAIMGESALALGNCEIAIKSFETLVDLGDKKAKSRLSQVKSACKN